MKDYRIKITIRNDRLLSAIEGMGHESVMSFCKRYNLPYTSTNDLISGKKPPLKDNGSLTERCKDLLEILGISVEEAFTERQLEGFSKTTFETKAEEKQLIKMISPAKNQEIRAIESDVSSKITEIMSRCLGPREEKVIRMRYGLNVDKHCYTYEEIGLALNITRERARQIEMRALSKFRQIKNSRDLLNTGFYETFTSVNIKPEQLQEAEFFQNVKLKEKIDYRNQVSKEFTAHINRLCNQVNKEKNLSNHKKEQIKDWIKKTLSNLGEGKYSLRLKKNHGDSFFRHTWMYKQIKSIMEELKYDEKSYYKQLKLRNKLKTRKCVALGPHLFHHNDKRVKYFIYYKPEKGERNE